MAQNRTDSYIYVYRQNYSNIGQKGCTKREENQERSQRAFKHEDGESVEYLTEHIMKRY